MIAGAPLSYWIAFHILVVILLAVDLVFLNHKEEKTARRLAWGWTLFLACLAVGFAFWVFKTDSRQHALEFFSSYLIETSLSVSLLARFAWVEDVFGLILLFAAIRLMMPQAEHGKPSPIVRWIQSQSLKKAKPVEAEASSRPLTLTRSTFLLIILAVEATDLVFALDSIPAVLAITRDPFIAYTSNIFAVLGLRSLFFALSGLLDRFRLLHYGLGLILAFVAAKMLLARWFHVNVVVSLAVVLSILVIFIVVSLIDDKKRSAG
jgi:tellurite resistance protein TerC